MIENFEYEFFLCHLVLANVFGTAMVSIFYILSEYVTQHRVHLNPLE